MSAKPTGGTIPSIDHHDDIPMQQNRRGEWVPAIPMPLYLFRPTARVACQCGRRFRGNEAYRGHYALAHILGLAEK